MNVTNKPISFDMTQARDIAGRYYMPMSTTKRAGLVDFWCSMKYLKRSPGIDKLMSDRDFLQWFLNDQMRVDVAVRPAALPA